MTERADYWRRVKREGLLALAAVLLFLLLLGLVGCASVEFKASIFQRARTVEDGVLAERLLCGGYEPAAVEAILRTGGTKTDDAARIVALALASRRCARGQEQ